MEVNLHRTRSLLGEKVIRLRHLEQSLHRANTQTDQGKLDDATLSDISSHSASSGISSTEFIDNVLNLHQKPIAILKTDFQEPSEIIQSLENLNLEIREIWDVLRTQQQQTSIAQGRWNTSVCCQIYLTFLDSYSALDVSRPWLAGFSRRS